MWVSKIVLTGRSCFSNTIAMVITSRPSRTRFVRLLYSLDAFKAKGVEVKSLYELIIGEDQYCSREVYKVVLGTTAMGWDRSFTKTVDLESKKILSVVEPTCSKYYIPHRGSD